MNQPRIWFLGFSLWLAGTLQADYRKEAGPVPEPPREFRAAWIASVFNLDWPSSAGLPAEKQQAELCAIFDRLQALGLNAVVLQVRPAGDAAYVSKLEPWSGFFSGSMGKSPGYDPLAFALTEAHRRGLQLHAWLNPFRALVGKHPASDGHLTRQHPDWVRTYGDLQWVDPGEPKARLHLLAVVADQLRRYDVDGIHIDDYFYPYPVRAPEGGLLPFPDDTTYAASGSTLSRADWRRQNIDTFIRDFYATAKAARPAAAVGISPFGIWRPNNPEGIAASVDSFEHLAADSRKWFREGWCDYFTPQLYWSIDPPKQSFRALLSWWQAQNEKKRHLWPGISTARIEAKPGTGRPAEEILRQIDLSRTGSPAAGHCHWRTQSLMQNRGGIATQLLAGPYAEKALPPAYPWLPDKPGAVPSATIAEDGDGVIVTWKPGAGFRWVAVQERTDGKWTLTSIAWAANGKTRLKGRAEAVALRFTAANGTLLPGACLWVRRG